MESQQAPNSEYASEYSSISIYSLGSLSNIPPETSSEKNIITPQKERDSGYATEFSSISTYPPDSLYTTRRAPQSEQQMGAPSSIQPGEAAPDSSFAPSSSPSPEFFYWGSNALRATPGSPKLDPKHKKPPKVEVNFSRVNWGQTKSRYTKEESVCPKTIVAKEDISPHSLPESSRLKRRSEEDDHGTKSTVLPKKRQKGLPRPRAVKRRISKVRKSEDGSFHLPGNRMVKSDSGIAMDIDEMGDGTLRRSPRLIQRKVKRGV